LFFDLKRTKEKIAVITHSSPGGTKSDPISLYA
jgi:hypothetical protein